MATPSDDCWVGTEGEEKWLLVEMFIWGVAYETRQYKYIHLRFTYGHALSYCFDPLIADVSSWCSLWSNENKKLFFLFSLF